jgi:hypothetical protein
MAALVSLWTVVSAHAATSRSVPERGEDDTVGFV